MIQVPIREGFFSCMWLAAAASARWPWAWPWSTTLWGELGGVTKKKKPLVALKLELTILLQQEQLLHSNLVLSYLSFLLLLLPFLSSSNFYHTFLFVFPLESSSWPCKTFSWPCKTSHPISSLCFCFCGRPCITIHWYRVWSPSFPVTTQLILSFLVYPSWAVPI